MRMRVMAHRSRPRALSIMIRARLGSPPAPVQSAFFASLAAGSP